MMMAFTRHWVRQNTDPTDILATAYDPMYYHYTVPTGMQFLM
jgi:hypothetical protein